MKSPLTAITEVINDRGNFLLATHVNPDGDALGSILGLGAVLESLGKRVFRYCEDTVPYLYHFLPGRERLMHALPDLGLIDCVIALDCGDQLRLGSGCETIVTVHPFIVLDHHLGHKDFGDLSWIDPARSSTGEMVYDLAMALGGEISPATAFCLYTAIASDTGAFRYPCTSAETFKTARQLVLHGVDPAEIAEKLFNNFTINRFNLLRTILSSQEFFSDNRIALMVVTQDMLKATATTLADTEHFINYSLALETVRIAAAVRETADGRLSVSLRSKGDLDVAKIAAKFGGGGHRNAAGFRIHGLTTKELADRLIERLMIELEEDGHDR